MGSAPECLAAAIRAQHVPTQSLRKQPNTVVSLTRTGEPLRFEYTLVGKLVRTAVR